MTSANIAFLRLQRQHITSPDLTCPEDVVKWFGAVQAQDYLGALWAVGLRMKKSTEAVVEDALARRVIIRTWPMRGTLHFVAAEDARWMLKLLTPRVVAANLARIKRDYDLDERVIGRSEKIIVRALEGNRQLSRDGIYDLLEKNKIVASGQRGLHILWRLAQHGVVCFAARQGKQQTFALFNEWIPSTRELSREESLAELASRYFTSHGPATVHDFAWWSGLSITDARRAYELVKTNFQEEKTDKLSYVLPKNVSSIKRSSSTFLLPAYDEFSVAYADRTAMIDAAKKQKLTAFQLLSPIIIINGCLAGTWKRTLAKDNAALEVKSFSTLTPKQKKAIEQKANQYGKFLNLKISNVRFIR